MDRDREYDRHIAPDIEKGVREGSEAEAWKMMIITIVAEIMTGSRSCSRSRSRSRSRSKRLSTTSLALLRVLLSDLRRVLAIMTIMTIRLPLLPSYLICCAI
ncbi:hypothetical protein BVRB_011740 [Beta vulgaris subsp. vulgaris]|uniref:Uncharacterized protein n=1 Tax=Beta vulgaris subsp. vulgaris TaxID=3555 RepID=A0A0J8B5I9_BETVV|nr:hypothetical protein BVRB_011740 [Beta vulgaris subsp. vulgaris]